LVIGDGYESVALIGDGLRVACNYLYSYAFANYFYASYAPVLISNAIISSLTLAMLDVSSVPPNSFGNSKMKSGFSIESSTSISKDYSLSTSL